MTLAKRKIRTPPPPRVASAGHRLIELGSAVLKKAGGSLVMTVPASARDALHLSEGTKVTISLAGGRLVLEPVKADKPKYALEELLAQCDFDAPYTDEERAWLDSPRVGRELA